MLRRRLLNTSIIVSTACITAAPAFADVTAADVWANTQAIYSAIGATVSGTPRPDGDATVIDDGALLFTLPFGAGTIQSDLPPMRLIDNSDGSVTMAGTGSYDITVTGRFPETPPIFATFTVDQTGYSGTVTGTPEEMLYQYESGPYTFVLKEFQFPEEEVELTMTFAGEGYSISSTVKTDDMITVTGESVTMPMAASYSFGGQDFSSTSETTYQDNTASYEIALLKDGADILNLTSALVGGMKIGYGATSSGNTSHTTTTIGDMVVSDQLTEVGEASGNMTLSAEGLSISGVAQNLLMSITQPDLMPFAINAEAASVSGGYTFPVIAKTEPQEFGLDLEINSLRVSPEIWALFDPSKGLPRDPAEIVLNLNGTTINEVDLFDVMALEDKFSQSTPPFSLESLNIGQLSLAALGAKVDGSSQMTFDNADLHTYDGFPRPIGDAFMAVTGANTLLDRMQEIGLLTNDETTAARFGMAFIARSTGDDSFETTVEFNEEGHLSVNGQRMR